MACSVQGYAGTGAGAKRYHLTNELTDRTPLNRLQTTVGRNVKGPLKEGKNARLRFVKAPRAIMKMSAIK